MITEGHRKDQKFNGGGATIQFPISVLFIIYMIKEMGCPRVPLAPKFHRSYNTYISLSDPKKV